MNKIQLINEFRTNHNLFVEYINSLTDKNFNSKLAEKWNAGQELDHIVKSIEPLSKILGSKATIIENFGTINREIIGYTDVINKYKDELKKGGVAIGKFIPEEEIGIASRKELVIILLDYVKIIAAHLNNLTEDELDTLILPHPLLGKLTIREMLYFTIYHVQHHKNNLEQNITKITSINNA